MSESRRKVVSDCLESRRPELKSGIIRSVVRNSAQGFLVDTDWRISYVISSSQMEMLKEAVAVFTLTLSTAKTVVLELTLSEVDSLLSVLQEIQGRLVR